MFLLVGYGVPLLLSVIPIFGGTPANNIGIYT